MSQTEAFIPLEAADSINEQDDPYNVSGNDSTNEEDILLKPKNKKRVTRFCASDSESGDEIFQKSNHISDIDKEVDLQTPLNKSSDSECDSDYTKRKLVKGRVQYKKKYTNSDESGSDSAVKNYEQQLRMKNKNNKIRDKFKNFMTARGKETSIELQHENNDTNSDSNTSDDEIGSIEKIKQKIKEKIAFKPSVCDPDTSDEEVFKQKNERKRTKSTSPKPLRMSAKQAMENMQKIKSESNRMLREKEVSLPYHRPKALCLKDIMNRRKPALSADGKALPIKMNEQQLRQYAKMLEDRQKEIMELCKSESEEENENEISNGPNNEDNANIEFNADKLTIKSNTNEVNEPDEMGNNNNRNRLQEDLPLGEDVDMTTKEQDSEKSMCLVYNESVNSEENKLNSDEDSVNEMAQTNNETCSKRRDVMTISEQNTSEKSENVIQNNSVINKNTEDETQLISLHFDSEQSNVNKEHKKKETMTKEEISPKSVIMESDINTNLENEGKEMEIDNEFSDDEINMEDIDSVIENAEIIKDIEDKVNSQMLFRNKPLNLNPKLTGAPGMVIDLDVEDSVPRKSGVELLKEKFTYFAKLKTPDELEREKEKMIKPGAQLKKLKQELEEKIAEQRSLEWAKRREEEEQQQKELKILRGEDSDGEDIDKLDAELESKENEESESEAELGEEEEEPIEDDIEIKDNVKRRNSMIDDEVEVSDCDDQNVAETEIVDQDDENVGDEEDNEEDVSESGESDESSESESELPSTKRKGRILKAFEDSDDEDNKDGKPLIEPKDQTSEIEISVQSQTISQDDELQLAQRHKSVSDDVFTSQERALVEPAAENKSMENSENNEILTQTFSILESSKQDTVELDCNNSGKLCALSDTQSLETKNIDNIILPYHLSDTQKELPSQIPTMSPSQSQPIGEDVLALCTGQFYNNEFVSQLGDNQTIDPKINYAAFENCDDQETQEEKVEDALSARTAIDKENIDTNIVKESENFIHLDTTHNKVKVVDDNLKSILDELDDPEYDTPKPNKFFTGGKSSHKENNESQGKKKFRIDSDEEENTDETNCKQRKKFKKKKAEKRALRISDDEDESENEEIEEYESDIEEDNTDRLVAYDSEENEIEILPQNAKKKRKGTDFLENEAELTSEDEWVGSGDEDEAGLDRMEREAGDDDTFHQEELQRELGQIHMRDVLDQDKREVRIIQELLFEDGDLGAGGRQRKFRWNNIDGNEEMGTTPNEFVDTQEDEFESEELWRKQRHEREMFLRQMREKEDPDESLNVSISRTTLIKANLNSKTSNLLEATGNNSHMEKTENNMNTARDIPSPKKPFPLMQQSHQGSLLFRGRSSLARLAALATPLAADEDKLTSITHGHSRNFVFAALNDDEVEPKVMKRKADPNPATPKLVKKMKTEENNASRNSLLDHFNV